MMMQNRIPALPLTATFGDNLSYRFTADVVELNADLQCTPSAPVGQDWALQLWADNAIKIAELPLGPLFPDDQGQIRVSGTAPARIPAGERLHALSLSLVSGAGGVYDNFHDCREFPRLQRFQQPCLRGEVECRFNADEIIITIAGIENPRDADNLSGTLALEVWSLEAPYEDGAWDGALIASFSIGRLNGQSVWSNACFIAQNAPLPATGYLTLMLREWTPDGYAPRDYRPLDRPTNPASVVDDGVAEDGAVATVAVASVAEAPAAVEPAAVEAPAAVEPAAVVGDGAVESEISVVVEKSVVVEEIVAAAEIGVAEAPAAVEPAAVVEDGAVESEISVVVEKSVVVEESVAAAEIGVAEAPAAVEPAAVVEDGAAGSEISVVEAPVAALDERPPAKSLGARLLAKVRGYFGG